MGTGRLKIKAEESRSWEGNFRKIDPFEYFDYTG
jgi:hypothetical protein